MILVRQIVLTLRIHVFGNFCLVGHEIRHKTLYFFKEGPPSRVQARDQIFSINTSLLANSLVHLNMPVFVHASISSIMHFVHICINRTLATDQDIKIVKLWRPSL